MHNRCIVFFCTKALYNLAIIASAYLNLSVQNPTQGIPKMSTESTTTPQGGFVFGKHCLDIRSCLEHCLWVFTIGVQNPHFFFCKVIPYMILCPSGQASKTDVSVAPASSAEQNTSKGFSFASAWVNFWKLRKHSERTPNIFYVIWFYLSERQSEIKK